MLKFLFLISLIFVGFIFIGCTQAQNQQPAAGGSGPVEDKNTVGAVKPNNSAGAALPQNGTPAPAAAGDARNEMMRLLELETNHSWHAEYKIIWNGTEVMGYVNRSYDGKSQWRASDGTFRYYALNGPAYYLCDDSGTTSAGAREGEWVCYNQSKPRSVLYSPDNGLLGELKNRTMTRVQKVESKKWGTIQTECFETKFTVNSGTYCYNPKDGALLSFDRGNGIVQEAIVYVAPVYWDDEFVLPTTNVVDAGENSIVS